MLRLFLFVKDKLLYTFASESGDDYFNFVLIIEKGIP